MHKTLRVKTDDLSLPVLLAYTYTQQNSCRTVPQGIQYARRDTKTYPFFIVLPQQLTRLNLLGSSIDVRLDRLKMTHQLLYSLMLL